MLAAIVVGDMLVLCAQGHFDFILHGPDLTQIYRLWLVWGRN
jgi:hypothetical protein